MSDPPVAPSPVSASVSSPSQPSAPVPSRPSKTQTRAQNKQPEKEKEPTKVVIRRLPPGLPETVLKKALEKWLPETDWFEFVQGKVAKQWVLERL
jgi:regulator of nonsense transcripts 3